MTLPTDVDLSKPKYDQSTYINRAKHFFLVTNPLNVFTTGAQLDRAKRIIDDYKAGRDVSADVATVDELWDIKYLYDSAFHPDTGEKMLIIGRMSAQVPMNTMITGCMLAFYRSTPAVVFWQWANQTFNAAVNYTNRSGDSPMSPKHMMTSYALATSGALVTALSLNHFTRKLNPLVGRLVPLVAVAAANCINIPMMRNIELTDGIALVDDKQKPLEVKSQKAAFVGISAVVLSRIGMAIPGMAVTPVVVQALTNRGFFKRNPRLNVPIQMFVVGTMLIFATPLGCAFFSQTASINVSSLEPHVQEAIKAKRPELDTVLYNKGL